MISQSCRASIACGMHLGEVDFDAAGVVREAGDLPDLLAADILQPGRHRPVLSSNHDVHLHLASVCAATVRVPAKYRQGRVRWIRAEEYAPP